ncbi:hypothetical protein [Thioclava sp. GXIMD4216]|uniref:Minor curlin subunit n=1 Tax=Thioclava litoralis TaxID=3076557 RepID=A0ABZ1E382_9RHOB|nr:hypothetical protein RPE78_03805 [Thioclava sp. FTW29]
MKTVLTTAAILFAATAGIASAQSNDAQLAALLQVNGAQFTTAELNNINEARRDGDVAKANYYLNHENRTTAAHNGQGKAQLAAQLGVNASDYTLAELVTIDSDRRDNNIQNADFVLNGTSRNSVAPIATPYIGTGRR